MLDDIIQYIVEMLFDDFVSKLFYGAVGGMIVWGKSIWKANVRKIKGIAFLKKPLKYRFSVTAYIKKLLDITQRYILKKPNSITSGNIFKKNLTLLVQLILKKPMVITDCHNPKQMSVFSASNLQ